MVNYYNDSSPACAAWLRELLREGLIPKGEIDNRKIQDVTANDIRPFRQCHFFAGIGGWPYALALAGWPEDAEVWTGSCPCQPFSCAGRKKGIRDDRHVWPELHRLIAECRPAVIFGEQVASPLGRIWLSGVRTDLEALAYAVGAADLCAASISAPMVSQRLHWMAAAEGKRRIKGKPHRRGGLSGDETPKERRRFDYHDPITGLATAHRYHAHWWSGPLQVGRNCIEAEITRGRRALRAQWRVKPGIPLLAHGVPGRVAQLCGFGNAIVPQVAAEFVQACMEAAK